MKVQERHTTALECLASVECEKAVLLTRLSQLECSIEGFERLYFGVEFCQRLIPPRTVLDKALRLTEAIEFTLVTPYVTDAGLQRLKPLLSRLAEVRPEAEVVINDWGVCQLIKDRYPHFKMVLGRLLVKQKRGPRILSIMSELPQDALEHFRRASADSTPVLNFLESLGIQRIELDNLLQGIVRKKALPASLYYPYGYITTTRLCLTNSCYRRRPSFRAIFPCKKDCRLVSFTLTSPQMPVEIILRGNTQFFYNDRLPDNPHQLHIDRIVYEPEPPL